ncbi:MAG: DUF3782 domain-containing protein [Anaerolineae bacterium]|nr:DUF3782 domain-containing protein [Anaerolineae bacterium]MDW8068616.1 DUF3782 domain-containing protein [Anaerolineae bacterium]
MAVEKDQNIIPLIRQQLPELIRRDPEIRAWVLQMAEERFADRVQTDRRFAQMLAEGRQEREEWNRRWEEQRAEWERRWEESERRWADWEQRWEEQRADWERRWQEMREDWERRWRDHQDILRTLTQRIDTGISAIGARWGIFAESAFRSGIQAILEESFGVQVLRYQAYDEAGEVFGRPDQVELDRLIRNHTLIVCEIKSSISRSDMHAFDRKVRFYERREGRQADCKIVISPMVEEQAMRLAQQELGIEVDTYADEVPL